MKNIYSLILFVITLFLFTNSVFAQWDYIVPPNEFYGANYLINRGTDLYLATNQDVFKSSDGGDSWENLSNGFISDAGNSNIYIQFAGDNIFVASTIKGVFMSPDNGANWQLDTAGIDPEYSTQVDLLYSDGSKIFASRAYSTYGFYMKDAAPGPWTRVVSGDIGTGYSSEVFGMTKIGDTYYAATRSLGVFESTDGTNWVQKTNTDIPSDIGPFSFVTNRLTSIGSTLFLATPEVGIHQSTDGGDSWSRVDQGFATWNQFSTTAIMCLYSDGTNLYASMGKDDSAYVSTDMGNTWNDMSTGLDHFIKSFAMHDGELFAAQWDIDSGIVKYSGVLEVEKEDGAIPSNFELSQNYPNPFNPSTTIQFSLPKNSFVSLKVYDTLGREVSDLVNEELSQGKYSVNFDGQNLTSGVYFYRIETKEFKSSIKMTLLK